jgi:diguanylate cyclase
MVVSTQSAQQVANDAMTFMAQHSIAPMPDNFQLFFTLAAGADTALKQAVGEILSANRRFTAAVLDDLQSRFGAAKRAERVMADLGAGMSGTLNSVLERIATAERDAVDYGRTLSAASGELGAQTSPGDLRKLVGTLMTATQTMEARTRDLEVELQRSSEEVGELKAKLDDVRKEALTDALTGISNRKAFDAELGDAMARARRTGEPLCVFMCDVDRFKKFNDTWGHQTGDQVLRLVANCLSENVKGRDTAARYGGEEFAVILPQTALPDAIAVANSIRTRVQSKKLLKKSTGDILGVITISIGVAQFAPNDTAESFVQRADSCLYAAKNAGRNLVMGQVEIPATRAA